MLNEPIIKKLPSITFHEIKDMAEYETLLKKGEIQQGDVCLIQDTGETFQVVDDALSTTSTNPVQNRVVTAALETKAANVIAKNSDIDKLFTKKTR